MKYLCLSFAVLASALATAQDFSETIKNYLSENHAQHGLHAADIADFYVYNRHFSKQSGVHHAYAVQRHRGIEIFNATANFVIRDGVVFRANLSRFIPGLAQKSVSSTPAFGPADAIARAAAHFGLTHRGRPQLIDEPAENLYLYEKGGLSLEDIPVKLVYEVTDDGLRLAWDLSIFLHDLSHRHSVRLDASNGDILSEHDWIYHCGLESFTPNDGSSYRVFPLPLESPNHGPDVLLSEPADPVASPFGWHDMDGNAGAEFTITRGNNVWARHDSFSGGSAMSPDGGANLTFDFPFDVGNHMHSHRDASTVNIFYWLNILHDLLYHYGFDEAAGNFQANNYGNGGQGNDPVVVFIQQDFSNAVFSPSPDGDNGLQIMGTFPPPAGAPAGDVLTVLTGSFTGGYPGIPASFGDPLSWNTPVTGELVLVTDDNSGVSTDSYDACDNITNGADITGKIAVVRRGECEFGEKVLNAENEGAIAVIVVNNVSGDAITMGGGAVGGGVTIPSIMVTEGVGEDIIAALENNETVDVELIDAGPYNIDASLDNGVAAHEYAHGVSNRLTGGAAQVGCLQNAEQPGEGWSDWYGMVLTMTEDDLPEDARGVGTFMVGQPVTGNGIRPAPYSTDFSINSYTYGDSNSPSLSEPHGVGFVWATMLWDLTWALIDEYGFDPDFYNGNGGNNIALQLVTEGLKLQPCSPGFVDARDAIIDADDLLYGGDNYCMIWEAFANRGLGFSADQGSSDNRSDQTEAFDMPSDCSVATEAFVVSNFSVYPNPSKGMVYINAKEAVSGDVTVYDLQGREVFVENRELSGTSVINLTQLPSGVYIMKVDSDAFSETVKLLINAD